MGFVNKVTTFEKEKQIAFYAGNSNLLNFRAYTPTPDLFATERHLASQRES